MVCCFNDSNEGHWGLDVACQEACVPVPVWGFECPSLALTVLQPSGEGGRPAHPVGSSCVSGRLRQPDPSSSLPKMVSGSPTSSRKLLARSFPVYRNFKPNKTWVWLCSDNELRLWRQEDLGQISWPWTSSSVITWVMKFALPTLYHEILLQVWDVWAALWPTVWITHRIWIWEDEDSGGCGSLWSYGQWLDWKRLRAGSRLLCISWGWGLWGIPRGRKDSGQGPRPVLPLPRGRRWRQRRPPQGPRALPSVALNARLPCVWSDPNLLSCVCSHIIKRRVGRAGDKGENLWDNRAIQLVI